MQSCTIVTLFDPIFTLQFHLQPHFLDDQGSCLTAWCGCGGVRQDGLRVASDTCIGIDIDIDIKLGKSRNLQPVCHKMISTQEPQAESPEPHSKRREPTLSIL